MTRSVSLGSVRMLAAAAATAVAVPALAADFAAQETFDTHPGPDDTNVVIADMDGDGDDDIVVGGSHLSLMVNGGSGEYTMQELDSVLPHPSITFLRFDVGDVDGDGDLDIFLTNQSTPSQGWKWRTVLFNDGDATFTSAGELEYPYAVFGDVHLADVDGDGDLDGLAGRGLPGSLVTGFAVYINNGSGAFTETGMFESGAGDSPQSSAVGDIDGDGDPDVVSGGFNSGEPAIIAIARCNGNGTFAAPLFLPSPGPEANSVKLADIDADDDLDLLVVDPNSDWVLAYRNDGSGTFALSGVYPTVGLAWNVAVGDLDGDGDADMAVSGDIDFGIFDHAEVWVHLNEGDGTFVADDQTYDVGDGAFWIDLSDVEGDGDLDMLTLSKYDWFFSLLRNVDPGDCDLDGDGVIGFTDLTMLLGGWGRCPASCPADLDGDGSVGFTDLTALLGAWGGCL